MIVVPFRAQHLKEIHLQPAQAWMQPFVDAPEYLRQLEACDSYTALLHDQVVAIAGLVTVWPGRAHLSALISDDLGGAFIQLHREVERRLRASPLRRIEATVDDGFEAAHRWLRMLGFELETPNGMRGYMPNGGTSYLYARVQ